MATSPRCGGRDIWATPCSRSPVDASGRCRCGPMPELERAGPASVIADLARWLSQGQRAWLATVVAPWGSSPRPQGAWLAISDRGEWSRSVSGGLPRGKPVATGGAGLSRPAVAAGLRHSRAGSYPLSVAVRWPHPAAGRAAVTDRGPGPCAGLIDGPARRRRKSPLPLWRT